MVALKREKVRALVGRRTLIPTAGEGVTLRLDLTHAVIPELRAALDEELAMVAARPVEGLVAPLRLATGADHVQLALEPIHGGALRLADMLRGLGRRGEGLGDGLAAALTATATQLCHKIHLGPGHAGAPRAHAALHPGTLLLTPAGTVALLGCGLPGVDGLLIPAEPEPELQSAAPELMRGQRPDALSDVYALGALYLTLLSGQPPWGGRSEGEIRAALGRGQVPPLPGALPDPRPSLVTLLRRALAPTPGDRFPTALALGQAISRELKDSGQPRASAETLTRMLATAVPADALRGPEILLGRPAPTAAGPAPTEGDLHRGWSMVLQEPGSSPSGPTLPRPAEVMTAPTSRPTPPATAPGWSAPPASGPTAPAAPRPTPLARISLPLPSDGGGSGSGPRASGLPLPNSGPTAPTAPALGAFGGALEALQDHEPGADRPGPGRPSARPTTRLSSDGGEHGSMKGTLIVGAGLILVIAGIWAATRGGDEATVPGQPGAAVDAMDAGQVATPAPIELPDVGFGFKTPLAKPEPEDAAVKAVGMLTVISTPSGATVELDGGYVGKTPLVLQHDFEDREYEVKVLAEGYKPWQQRLRPHQQLRTINVVSILEKEERRR